MSKADKFHLKSFFESEGLKPKAFDNIYNQFSQAAKKIKSHQDQMEKNIQKLGYFELNKTSSMNLKDIYNEYQTHWKVEGTVKNLPSKSLRKYFQILFANPNEGIPKGLYDDSEQFEDFLEALIKQNRQSYLKRLISDLLYYYPNNKKFFFQHLNRIYGCLDRKRKSNQALFKANKEFLIIKEKGPEIIVQHILNSKKNLSETLSRIWLREKHLISNGIGGAIVKKLCDSAKYSIQTQNKIILECFIKYLSGANNIPRFNNSQPAKYYSRTLAIIKANNIPRFNNSQPVVSVLLRPFKESPPTQTIKKEITKFLDQYIGDPRFKPEKWINMEIEKDIFLKWKIGETLKDFFELLSYTAKQQSDSNRMWADRKEFIEAYWKEGQIRAAWIVLGREDYKHRLKFLKENFNGYGKIVRGAYRNQSVLLFQIGSLTLSEWNYNGKARVWIDNPPQFYKTEYSREDLIKNPKEGFIHSYSDRYYWQKRLSQYIEEYTGIPCPEKLRKKMNKF